MARSTWRYPDPPPTPQRISTAAIALWVVVSLGLLGSLALRFL